VTAAAYGGPLFVNIVTDSSWGLSADGDPGAQNENTNENKQTKQGKQSTKTQHTPPPSPPAEPFATRRAGN